MPPVKRAPINKTTSPTGAEETSSGPEVENVDLPEEEQNGLSLSAQEVAEMRAELAALRKRADDSDARAAAAVAPSDDPREAASINIGNWLKAKKAARPDVDFSELEDAFETEDWDTVRDVSTEFLANNGGKELESLRPLLADYRRAYKS